MEQSKIESPPRVGHCYCWGAFQIEEGRVNFDHARRIRSLRGRYQHCHRQDGAYLELKKSFKFDSNLKWTFFEIICKKPNAE